MSDATEGNGGKPPNPQRKPPSVFALASPPISVDASITVNDVLELRPHWTRKQAAAFLIANAEVIGSEMVVRGIDTLVAVLGSDNDAN
jgi:hypothetical protein